jgi:two-component system, cell cycle sensor histidine kinase and response regulator CckA
LPLSLFNRLTKLNIAIFVAISVALSEILTSLMSIFLRGMITSDYLITGGVVSLVVSGIVVYLLQQVSRLSEDNVNLRREIASRQEAEEMVRRTEQTYKALIETTNTGFVLLDKNGAVLDANQEYVKLTGHRTLDEIKGKVVTEWTSPEDRQRNAREVGKCLKRGFVRNLEINYIDSNGLITPIEINATAIESGVGTKILTMCRDITERKLAEGALKISEEKYRLVVENANDAIFIAQDGMIKFPNHQLTNLTGYSEKELTKVSFSNFLSADDKEMVVDRHQRRLRGEKVPTTYSFRVINKDGETLWVEASTVVINWEDRPASLNFLRDITIQKKLEEQLLHAQKMEAIGTLAGGVAHDFNNLLMGILGYTSLMLMKTDKSHPFHDKLKIIEQQVESGAQLTKQLLGFARGGKYEVNPLNINDLIIKTAEIFGRTKKEITIHKTLQEDLYTIEADSGQIEQVLMNLYLNAWQAMPSGGSLYIETQNSILDEKQYHAYYIKPGPYVKISVTDTGVGMDAKTQKRIFDPFFSTKEIGKGTGLGLASAYGIIKNHGGIINVFSEKGHGTTFTMHLPASGAQPAEAKPSEENLLTGNETILLVDDEPINVETVKELLEALGYKILTAQSGKEAIELYREYAKDIHLVILDMIMPEMNGRETLERLMETDKNVSILLASGYSMNGEAKSILDLGCKGFIQKPFHIEDLSRKIRYVLDSAHS